MFLFLHLSQLWIRYFKNKRHLFYTETDFDIIEPMTKLLPADMASVPYSQAFSVEQMQMSILHMDKSSGYVRIAC